MEETLSEILNNLVATLQTPATQWTPLSRSIAGLVLLALALLVYHLTRWLLFRLVSKFFAKYHPIWSSFLLKRRLFSYLAFLVALLLVYLLLPRLLAGYPDLSQGIYLLLNLLIIATLTMALASGLNVASDIYQTREISKMVPLTGLVQGTQVVVFFLAGIAVLALILHVPAIYVLGGLGALAAALSFVFHDPILNFIGGLQLAANKMVAIGDWIEVTEYGADGFVQEINLTAVKVQNWDMTITTLPTYTLVSKSFKNWRGMEASGGRRIKRAIYLDVRSIRPCTTQLLADLAGTAEVAVYLNRPSPANACPPATNLGLFRAYMVDYLKHHAQINPKMLIMVRQLPPTEHGLPLELYAFTTQTDLIPYETVQSDILEYCFTLLPVFGLVPYQDPTGNDRMGLPAPA
ncbi:MAG TPA: mechanosensitive ion channel domain-containing protein [Anaerolineae bacterium]|nr:mechanosensitive ion channel domain-containing protein [Anaerolineae bacterium]